VVKDVPVIARSCGHVALNGFVVSASVWAIKGGADELATVDGDLCSNMTGIQAHARHRITVYFLKGLGKNFNQRCELPVVFFAGNLRHPDPPACDV
jgi:hypothetical protein